MNGTTPSLANHVAFLNGRGELPMLEILTRWSRAELYLHGGQVTHFQKEGEPPILFTSQCSRFEPGVPIRGGIPVIFPWFGQPEGRPHRHGIARLRDSACACPKWSMVPIAPPAPWKASWSSGTP
jgi:glucose-6-phosphate 1-epimerase